MDVEEFARSSIPCPVSTCCYHLLMQCILIVFEVTSYLTTYPNLGFPLRVESGCGFVNILF